MEAASPTVLTAAQPTTLLGSSTQLAALHPLLSASPSDHSRPSSPTQEMLEKARAREVVLVRKGKLRQAGELTAATGSPLQPPAREEEAEDREGPSYLEGRNIVVQKAPPEALKYFVQLPTQAASQVLTAAQPVTKLEVEEAPPAGPPKQPDFIIANEEITAGLEPQPEPQDASPLISVSSETLNRFRDLIARLEPASRASLTPSIICQILVNLQAAGGRLEIDCGAAEQTAAPASVPMDEQVAMRSHVADREPLTFASCPQGMAVQKEATVVQKSPLKKRPVSYR